MLKIKKRRRLDASFILPAACGNFACRKNKQVKPEPGMADNKTVARVRVSVEGIEASKKHLESLKTSADSLRKTISGLKAEQDRLVKSGNVEGAAKVVEELRKQESALKDQASLVKLLENEIGNYDNIMEHLSDTTLLKLNQAARQLQAQMKAQLTAADPERWKEMNDAYRKVMETIEQLNGKAPNLAYVMQNLGTVSEKSLKDSDEYLKRLIATADKGSQEITGLQQKLERVQAEQRSRDAARADRVLGSGNLPLFSVSEIQEAIKATERLRDTQQTGTAEWGRLNGQIRTGNEYLSEWNKRLERAEVDKMQGILPAVSDSQLAAQRKYWEQLLADTKQGTAALGIYRKKLAEVASEEQARLDRAAGKVMGNLPTSSVTEIQEAIRTTEKLRDAQAAGSAEWEIYNNEIEKAKRHLQEFADMGKQLHMEDQLRNASSLSAAALAEQRKYWEGMVNGARMGSAELAGYEKTLKRVRDEEQARLAARAGTAIGNVSGGTFGGSMAQAKEALETLREYKESLNLSTQQAEIERVSQAMEAYSAVMGKAKEAVVDWQKVLADPQAYSTRQIEDAVKQLEEMRKGLQAGDTAGIRQATEDMESLREALSRIQYEEKGIDRIVGMARAGTATLSEMEDAVSALNKRLKETPPTLANEIEDIRQKLDVLNPALANTRNAIADVGGVLHNLKGASFNDLKSAAEALEKEIQQLAAGTTKFKEKAQQLKEVKARIKEVSGEWSNANDAMDNAISRLKNWVLIYMGWDAITSRIGSLVRGNLSFSDSLSDVRKVTGMQADEVARLSKEIQKLNTRITDPELLEAATEGGRLGLKSAEDIFAFTKASAITLTALDELDAKSVNSVMKLNNLLGETERLGVQDAILSTASSINELSIASAAAQAPIIDFSRRFGGIASQAHISTAEVMALGATLDALGQPIEMSSTAMNKFVTALLSNQAEIAKATGLTEEYMLKMTQQGRTVDLMIEVLTRLSGMGGIGQISKYMGDMGGDGARMTAVIAALASNVGFLRQQLDVSNTAFAEGTSVINEYNIKNENAAALVERMGNSLKALFVNSGAVSMLTKLLGPLEKLVSFMASGSTAARLFNHALSGLFLVMAGGSKTAGKLAALVSGFLKSMARGLVVFGKDVFFAVSSVRNFAFAIKYLLATNPFGWIALAVSAVISLADAFGEASKETGNLKSATDRANEAFEDERYKLTLLKGQLDKAAESKSGYAEVISTLNRDYGKHVGYLLDEAAGYREIASAIDVATLALRRKALEDARNKVAQEVNEEYRMPLDESRKGLREDLGGIRGLPEEAARSIYNAINKDLLNSVYKDGKASMGSSTEEALKAEAERFEASLQEERGTYPELFRKKVEARYGYLKKQIQSLGSYKELVELYNSREKEIADQTGDANTEYLVARENEIEGLRNHVETVREESGIMEKAAKDFTDADESALDAIAKTQEHLLASLDPDKQEAEWAEAAGVLKKIKSRQREVMLAYVENPLKGIKMEEGANGKLEKLIEQDGRFRYEAVGKLTDANLRMLQQAYIRSEATFQKINSDENMKLDSAWREQANRLGRFKASVKEYLKQNRIAIDSKGSLTLMDTEPSDSSSRRTRSENQEMQKSYRALLENLEEFFNKRKQVVNKAYLDNAMTAEQHGRELEEIERAHLQTRVEMQEELLGEGERFNEQAYIRDLGNYTRVMGWMLKDTHHFQDTVRQDMEKGNAKIQDSLIRHRQEIEKILLDNRAFAKIRRQYQEELERLELLFVKTDDIGEDDFMGMQKRAETAMDILSEAGKKATDMSYRTFRDIVSGLEGAGDALAATGREDGKLLLKGTEEDWQAIYAIIMKYNNDIQSERARMFNENKSMIDKMVEQSDEYRSLAGKDVGISDEVKRAGAGKEWGAGSEGDAYRESYRINMDALENEIALYDLRLNAAKAYYDNLIAAAQDEAEKEALVQMQKQQMADVERESQEKQAEYLREITEAYMEEYDRRLGKATEYADRIGEFTGTMASAAWNTVEDRKKAGEELLKWMAEETKRYILELVTRSIKEKLQQKLDLTAVKENEKKKNDAEQLGADTSNVIQQAAGQARIASEKLIGGTVTDIATTTAVANATTSVQEAGVETTAGIAAGSAKTIGKLGWWGIPLVAVITALLNGLLSMATGALSSAFGKSAGTSGASNKRLATGMLTYAGGRYEVQGDDGHTYDAQYEPVLQTRIYPGGNGKAHFGIFSEKMPEMVVSGPTTKIIREDYPELLNAIMTVEKHGRLRRSMPVFAAGNVSSFGVEGPSGEAQDFLAGNPVQEQMMEAMRQMDETNRELVRQLRKGIRANVDMYGKSGLKEKLKKADRFYGRNKLD